MKWLEAIWNFITARRDGQRRDIDQALGEWRRLYDAQVARNAQAEARLDALERRQSEIASELQRCLDDCRACYEARLDLEKEIVRMRREINELEENI